MLLPTVLDIPPCEPKSEAQACPFCASPVFVLRCVGQRTYVGSDPDHIVHRALYHGETPLVCFPVRRAADVLADDWQAVADALEGLHTPPQPA